MKIRKFISEYSAKSNVSDCSYSYTGVFKIKILKSWFSKTTAELHFPTELFMPCPSVFPQKPLCRAWIVIIAVHVLAATSQPGYSVFCHNPFW